MVVTELNPLGSFNGPSKTEAPLRVDPDAVLSRPVALQLLQPVIRRNSEIPKIAGGVKDLEFPVQSFPAVWRDATRNEAFGIYPKELDVGVFEFHGI